MGLPRIEAITADVKIPSTGQEVRIRQMLAKEQKILLSAKADADENERAINVLKSVKQVIQNCIVTNGIDVDQLALFDIEWLFIRLHEISVTNVLDLAYRDSDEWIEYQNLSSEWANGDKKDRQPSQPPNHNFKVNLADVVIKRDGEVENSVKNGGITIELRYPPVWLYTHKPFLESTGNDTLDFLVRNSIKSVKVGNDVTDFASQDDEAKSAFINDMPLPSFNKIQEFLSNVPTVHYQIDYKNKFGTEKHIVFSKMSDFFTF